MPRSDEVRRCRLQPRRALPDPAAPALPAPINIGSGVTTDAVYLPVAAGGDGSLHLTEAFGVRGAFNHNWDRYLLEPLRLVCGRPRLRRRQVLHVRELHHARQSGQCGLHLQPRLQRLELWRHHPLDPGQGPDLLGRIHVGPPSSRNSRARRVLGPAAPSCPRGTSSRTRTRSTCSFAPSVTSDRYRRTGCSGGDSPPFAAAAGWNDFAVSVAGRDEISRAMPALAARRGGKITTASQVHAVDRRVVALRPIWISLLIAMHLRESRSNPRKRRGIRSDSGRPDGRQRRPGG